MTTGIFSKEKESLVEYSLCCVLRAFKALLHTPDSISQIHTLVIASCIQAFLNIVCMCVCLCVCLWYSCPWESLNTACVCRTEVCLYGLRNYPSAVLYSQPDDRPTNRLVIDWFSFLTDRQWLLHWLGGWVTDWLNEWHCQLTRWPVDLILLSDWSISWTVDWVVVYVDDFNKQCQWLCQSCK